MKNIIAILSICIPFSTAPYVIKTAVDTLNPELLYFLENQNGYTIKINEKLKQHFIQKLDTQLHESKELLHSPYSQAETIALVIAGLFFGSSLYAIKTLIEDPMLAPSVRYSTLGGWLTISALSTAMSLKLLNRSGVKGIAKRCKKLKMLINKCNT